MAVQSSRGRAYAGPPLAKSAPPLSGTSAVPAPMGKTRKSCARIIPAYGQTKTCQKRRNVLSTNKKSPVAMAALRGGIMLRMLRLLSAPPARAAPQHLLARSSARAGPCRLRSAQPCRLPQRPTGRGLRALSGEASGNGNTGGSPEINTAMVEPPAEPSAVPDAEVTSVAGAAKFTALGVRFNASDFQPSQQFCCSWTP